MRLPRSGASRPATQTGDTSAPSAGAAAVSATAALARGARAAAWGARRPSPPWRRRRETVAGGAFARAAARPSPRRRGGTPHSLRRRRFRGRHSGRRNLGRGGSARQEDVRVGRTAIVACTARGRRAVRDSGHGAGVAALERRREEVDAADARPAPAFPAAAAAGRRAARRAAAARSGPGCRGSRVAVVSVDALLQQPAQAPVVLDPVLEFGVAASRSPRNRSAPRRAPRRCPRTAASRPPITASSCALVDEVAVAAQRRTRPQVVREPRGPGARRGACSSSPCRPTACGRGRRRARRPAACPRCC